MKPPMHGMNSFTAMDDYIFGVSGNGGFGGGVHIKSEFDTDAGAFVGGGGGMAHVTSMPTQFQLRFTHVDDQAAHVTNAAQTSLVNAGVEVAFPGLLEATEVDDLFTDGGMEFVGFTEGSIIVTFVVNMVQRKSAMTPDELVARVQQSLRTMTQESLRALMPGLTLDAEFTKVHQLTSAELATMVVQDGPVDDLFGVAAENAVLRSTLRALVGPLREQRDQLVADNRKHRRMYGHQDVSGSRAEYHVLSASDEEFDGFSDPEDADFWSAPVAHKQQRAMRKPPPIPKKTSADIESVTAPMRAVSVSKSMSVNSLNKSGADVIDSPFRGDVEETQQNPYVLDADIRQFSSHDSTYHVVE